MFLSHLSCCLHLFKNLTDRSSHHSLESVPSLYRGTQCCTHTGRVQQCVPPPPSVPGSKVTPHYDGAELSLVQWVGQSLAQGAGQSPPHRGRGRAKLMLRCHLPSQSALHRYRSASCLVPVNTNPAGRLNCGNQKGYNPHSTAATALPIYMVSCSCLGQQ